MDVDLIKRAASGRWTDLFVSLGIPSECLSGDSAEHPCPKCGGTTRFRLIDRDAGALFCSHCFKEKNGDGIAAVQWWTGCDFQEAARKVAEFFGVKVGKSTTKRKPEDYLDFSVSQDLLQVWLNNHEPITLAAVQAAGGRVARFKGRDTVVTFPYHGEKKVTGYEMRPLLPGGHIHKWNDSKKGYDLEKKLACPGSTKNLMGPVDKIADAKVVLRVEGLTDMLVANSVMPEGWVAVAVAGSGNPKPWQAALFAGKDVLVVGDADDSGRDNAQQWAQAIAKHAASVKVPVLPYIHTASQGKDLRDYLLSHGPDAFIGLVENTAAFEPERDEAGTIKDVEPAAEDERLVQCLDSLGLDVLGETRTGCIYAYAVSTRKIITIPDIDKLKKPKLVQHLKDRARQYVSADPESHQFRISEVQEAISWSAADRRIDPDKFVGRGCWLLERRVVVCNGNHLSIWNGDALEYSETPYFGGAIFEFIGQDENWFDHEEMAELCGLAKNPQWCRSAIERLITLLKRWTWADEIWAPQLVAALAAATFLQSAWRIRPHASFAGPTGCGKSDCMKFFFGEDQPTGFFGPLRWFVNDTSSSGITQNVGNQSLAIAIDEWDQQKPRLKEELLEMLRAMSSGGSRARGSAHGKGRVETMRHMLWFAGITAGLKEAADLNRVLQLDMLKKPGTKKWQNFALPSYQEAMELGKQIMAGMVVRGAQAVDMAAVVESGTVADEANKAIDTRLLRLTSIPAACMAVLQAEDVQAATQASLRFAEYVMSDSEHEKAESHTDLLRSILAGKVEVGPADRRPVSQILASITDRTDFGQRLEAAGVRMVIQEGERYLAIRSVRDLVKDMDDKGARKLLRQFPGAFNAKVRMAGVSVWAVHVPWSALGLEDQHDPWKT